jgi:hypothetical protein
MTRLTTSELFPGKIKNLSGPAALTDSVDNSEYF